MMKKAQKLVIFYDAGGIVGVIIATLRVNSVIPACETEPNCRLEGGTKQGRSIIQVTSRKWTVDTGSSRIFK